MLWLWSGYRSPTVSFRSLQHFSYFLLSSPYRCFISVFVWFLCSRRCCTDELGTLHVGWTNFFCIPRHNYGRGLWPHKIDLSSPTTLPRPLTLAPSSIFTDFSKVVLLLWFSISVILCLCMFDNGAIFILDSRLAILWTETALLAFCL